MLAAGRRRGPCGSALVALLAVATVSARVTVADCFFSPHPMLSPISGEATLMELSALAQVKNHDSFVEQYCTVML
jgi:hypothetical protein